MSRICITPGKGPSCLFSESLRSAKFVLVMLDVEMEDMALASEFVLSGMDNLLGKGVATGRPASQ